MQVLLPVNHKNNNFREKKEQPSYESKGEFALKAVQRRRISFNIAVKLRLVGKLRL